MDDDDNGASVCPMWFGNTVVRPTVERARLRGAGGEPLRGYGTRQLWLRTGATTTRYEFHVADVTKCVLGASSLCESGVKVHVNRQLFLQNDEDRASKHRWSMGMP